MSVITYKCPNCGGELKFDAEGQNFKCEYCLSEFKEDDLVEIPVSQAVVYSCPSCGAEIVTDETTAATTCFYCHNPIVMAGRLSGEEEPDWVIPFAIDKEKAKEIFSEWMRKKRFLPRGFFKEDQLEKVTGVYFPYLLYSCRVSGKMKAACSKVSTWRSGDIEYRETKQYEAERDGDMEVSNLARNALKKTDKSLVESVLPFQMDGLKPFQMAYLSGFAAERKDMEGSDFTGEAEQEVRDYLQSSLKNSFTGYTTVSVREFTADISDAKWRYALLPVWTFTYQNKKDDKMYYFALNGQTGKTCGRLPVDRGKLALLFFEIFIPVFLFFAVVRYLL